MERMAVEVIDLRGYSVRVQNIEEYEYITKIAKKQEITWATGDDLRKVYCSFPTVLVFRDRRMYFNSTLGASYDYDCINIIKSLGALIIKRKGEML